jgi:hypothetical protein
MNDINDYKDFSPNNFVHCLQALFGEHEDMKNHIRTVSLFLCVFVPLCLIINFPLQAQQNHRYEWSASLGGGISVLQRSAVVGDYDFGGVTGAAGTGLAAFFAPHWGIEAGAEIAGYYNVFSIGRTSHTTKQPAPPGLGGAFYHTADYTGYRERQQSGYVQIPVRLVFLIPIGKQSVYTSGGFKAAIPLYGSESANIQSLTVTGYSDYTGQVYKNMPGHGFEMRNDVSVSSRPKGTTLYLLSMETGIRWTVSPKNTFSAGIYFDCGKISSLIQPVAFGLKIKIGIGYGKMEKKKIRL